MSDNSLEYAQMIEVPVNTCTVTYKKGARRKKKNVVNLKDRVIEKVNRKAETAANAAPNASAAAQKVKGKLNIVMVEFVIICLLCAVIFLTNLFIPQSGINTFLKNTFMTKETAQPHYKNYNEYEVSLPVAAYDELSVENGIMTFTGSASLYAPLSGTVTALSKDSEGRYILEIAHTDTFKTIISGASFAYYEVGDSVYSSIPVGYLKDGTANIYMYDQGSLLNNYYVQDGSIIWQV